jgi:fumarate reductase flavoprotein subunit
VAARGEEAEVTTRRELLAGLSGAAALLAAGNARAAATRSWDLIVVGAGTAGLPAALFAAQRGLRVLALEKNSQVGGTLWVSGGQMSAAGTRRQRALGIDDSPEEHLADIRRISRGTAYEPLVRRAVTEARSTLDWLDEHGFQFGPEFPLDATGHEPYRRRRVWGGPDRGRSVLAVLEARAAAAERRPTLVTQFEVRDLVRSRSGDVVGVRGVDRTGAATEYRGRHVVLASGGYMGNPALFAELNGVPQHRAAWYPLNTGIGVTLALAAGGYVRGRENYLCDFGSIPADLATPSSEFARSVHHPERRPPWEIWVNAEGRRFVSEEERSVDERERALVRQPDHRYWVVFDQAILDAAPALVRTAPPQPLRDWTREELTAAFGDVPAFVRGDTLDELAGRAGIDRAGLAATVAEYNRGVEAGSDPLGRGHRPRRIAQPPFYAIRHQGGTLISMAGVAVDDSLRVLTEAGDPVRGLYAVGEVLGNGSLSGQAFCSGMMVTPALSLGRWLGSTLT